MIWIVNADMLAHFPIDYISYLAEVLQNAISSSCLYLFPLSASGYLFYLEYHNCLWNEYLFFICSYVCVYIFLYMYIISDVFPCIFCICVHECM